MSAVEIPGKPPRWGNESANFYQASFTKRPGSASPQKSYRCYGSYYCNPGHYHVGTKAINHSQPLERYGTASAYKLRTDDQRLPGALVSPQIHIRRLTTNPKVNLYQSHQHHHSQYVMGKKTRPYSAEIVPHTKDTTPIGFPVASQVNCTVPSNPKDLQDSLSKAFYITSYQNHISQSAVKRLHTRSRSEPAGSTLVSLAVGNKLPIRPLTASSARQQSYSSKGEFLKEIYSKYPAPQPQLASQRALRPSSAVTLRTGKIPDLRT